MCVSVLFDNPLRIPINHSLMRNPVKPTTFASAKIAQNIASHTGDAPKSVQVRRVAQKDVNRFVEEIFQAQKSSRKAVMLLD